MAGFFLRVEAESSHFPNMIVQGDILKSLIFWLGCFFSALASATSASDVLPMTQVAAGIYVHFGAHQLPDKHNHGAIANIGFIIGKRCVAVIDSGGNPEQGRALKRAIEKITDKPVCYVINSHVHPDHIYGNSAFNSDHTQFVGHYKLARAISMRGPFYLEKAKDQLGLDLSSDDLVLPDIEVKKHMTLDLGGRKLRLSAHPTAHTDNDLTVYDSQTDTLWLSDLLFIDHIPVIDGSLKGWLKVLEGFENNNYAHVIPGHGPLITHWPEAMQAEKNYLNTLLTEIRQKIKEGVFLEDAINEVGKSEELHWKLFDEFHKRNVTTAFAELEWE